MAAVRDAAQEGDTYVHRIRMLAVVGVFALTAVIAASAPAAAGPIVDPDTLTPVPPPGAVCRANGALTLCHTVFLEEFANEPAFDLPCGTVYETVYDPRTGLRWYRDGLLVKRQVFAHAEGTWNLSPSGDGPAVRFIANRTWTDVYPVPGDEGSQVEVYRGLDLHVFGARGTSRSRGSSLTTARPTASSGSPTTLGRPPRSARRWAPEPRRRGLRRVAVEGEDASMAHETRYAVTRDGVHIAYQIVGDGPVDLVLCVSGLGLGQVWQGRRSGAFLERLASFSRLIIFDFRGTGYSDHVVDPGQLLTIEAGWRTSGP